MPYYPYRCSGCGQKYEQYRAVQERDMAAGCPRCESVLERVFVPTHNICVPAHFGVPRDWCLPDAWDNDGWDARQGNSTSHAPKEESFTDYFERTVNQFD